MISRPRLALVLALSFLAGCSSSAPPPPTASAPPRTRCLSNPSETTLRPMIFLFCVESP
ncbi:MAG TPA: hypothetical protein VGU22_03010 [Methylomirabilota bacterium]|nr:hypothetical protein [Methylomirabilota bacterium]